MPAPTTKCLLQNGLLVKPLRDGFLLLYETTRAGNNRSRETLLKDPVCLSFDLALTDQLFYNYTQMDAVAVADNFFFFSNDPQAAPGVLHWDSYVSALDLQHVSVLQERPLTKPFGRIVLQLDKDLQPSYDIRFQARATRWCYFLMSDGLRALARPAVISTNGSGAFEPAVQVSLPNTGLVPVFISVSPLPLATAAPPVFQLVDYSAFEEDRYKVIISALPAPDISRISNAAAALYKDRNDYSEIFLY
ncbi:hypothetical protein F0L74_27905 [Chitinophaga agrisoli]|uniref:Uncharacterized protein n=1 Tax=Chitinophaga agrisoli TaxID=2607653 RepID=A0A5B2VP85_9BACT|nr:hypothetical protein [Chitinophaga agrisoli]KAA2240007.1 hypothetical protein F0L74_27905 [Chitinophaga agrisoli]